MGKSTSHIFPPSTISKKLLPAADGNKWREWKLVVLQRMKDFGTPSFKWDVSIKSFLSIPSQGILWKLLEPWQAHIYSQWLQQQAQHLHWSTPGLLYVLQLLIQYFYWTPDCENEWIFHSYACSGESFPLVGLPFPTSSWYSFSSPYYILFCHNWLLYFGGLFFANETQKCMHRE